MADNNNIKCSKSYEKYCQRKIYDKFRLAIDQYYEITASPLNCTTLERYLCDCVRCDDEEDAAASLVMNQNGTVELLRRWLYSPRCLLQNNFFLMEISRPLTNCSLCENVKSAVVLEGVNATRYNFAHFAYSTHPVLVKKATFNWPAMTTFNLDFFKHIYSNVDGAIDSVQDECQFFPFRTEFTSLREVFEMPTDRAKGLGPEKTWYVGWSNCHPEIAKILRQHYTRPQFLPEDSESSAIDWIFIGWPGMGASIHLDFVQRPSWQAQISGEKLWRLFPPPECEEICHSFNITVQKGDIVLIDTNRWYHDTYIDHGEISITIGSEYD